MTEPALEEKYIGSIEGFLFCLKMLQYKLESSLHVNYW